ncbi:hypothetical protein like AT2G22070 [Hibiscus trionum]|uniref:DYW domain-containing protein n=1 Tax=Hibiscus trionum TaxID=183268 RepID=A0A9W7JEL5_HIBTR|nr:hypothetical protein like AT2G22070 [Hibiscus trionum]
MSHLHSHDSHRHKPTHLNHLLNATARTKRLKHATQIHSHLIPNAFISLPFLFNNLLTLYAKCGRPSLSLLLFSTAHQITKTVVSWTSLISILSHSAAPFQAMSSFNRMRTAGVYPNHFTFSAVLPACADTSVLLHGQQMHCLISKHGYEGYVFVGSALVDMYAKCHDMSMAEKVFVGLPERNVVSWNSIIVGCLLNGLHVKALFLFREVIREGLFCPDQVSFSTVLSASANIGALEFGKQVHGVVVRQGLLTLSYVKNSLMDMYFKCGLFDEGALLFNSIGIEGRDVIAWNVMSMGCVYNENFEEACNYLWIMKRTGLSPDEASYSTALHASAHLAAVDQGTLIHNQIIKSGFSKSTCIASSLITMYAKCGSLDDSCRVFEEVEDLNVVCWTALISACQQHGNGNHVIELFEKMLADGLKPNYITFVCVLSACGHTGRIEEGHAYFNSMEKVHGIIPGHEHYACMVDLLGRSGQLDEAREFIAQMPMKPNASVWGALLGACANYGNLEMGIEVAGRLFELEPNNPGNYVLLSNLYAQKGKVKEADQVRRLMGVNRVKKEPGCSWIDIKNKTFVFTVHDKSHARTDEIYQMLRKVKELVKNKGYVPQKRFAINSAEEFKEESLWYHSEKIALAFGLLALPAGAPVRIKKNLRTCGDCHTVMKLVSEILKREIIVRDVNRFHHFRNGLCSCRDYW